MRSMTSEKHMSSLLFSSISLDCFHFLWFLSFFEEMCFLVSCVKRSSPSAVSIIIFNKNSPLCLSSSRYFLPSVFIGKILTCLSRFATTWESRLIKSDFLIYRFWSMYGLKMRDRVFRAKQLSLRCASVALLASIRRGKSVFTTFANGCRFCFLVVFALSSN